jgi:hypothetical protein
VTIAATPASETDVWTKYTKTFGDFSAASPTNTLTLVSLPAKTVLRAVVIKHSAAFGGGTIVLYSISVDRDGGAQYVVISAETAPTDTNFQKDLDVVGDQGIPTFASWDVEITANAGVANLNEATGGVVDVWLKTAVLP